MINVGDHVVQQRRNGPHATRLKCPKCPAIVTCRPWERGTCPNCQTVIFENNEPANGATIVGR